MRIELHEVSKKSEKVQALDAVSLAVDPGQIVVILGPNGAGKTTLLRCLAGVVAPDKGELLYDGARFHRGRLDMRQRFLFLPDTPFVFGHMTVLRHLGMVLRLFDAGRDGVEDRVVEILRQLDLLPLADTALYKLSRGQLYKAALAGLLVVDPDVWLLDEPLASGMDPSGLSYFKECAREAARRGRTILYTTQIAEAAERFADRICLLHHGRVHVFETVEALKLRLDTEHGVLDELFRQLREAP